MYPHDVGVRFDGEGFQIKIGMKKYLVRVQGMKQRELIHCAQVNSCPAENLILRIKTQVLSSQHTGNVMNM